MTKTKGVTLSENKSNNGTPFPAIYLSQLRSISRINQNGMFYILAFLFFLPNFLKYLISVIGILELFQLDK